MKYSIVNNEFAAANAETIAALATVGNFRPTSIGQVTGLRSVDIRQLEGVKLFELPVYLEGETDMEYGLRVRDEVVEGVEKIIAGTLDGLFLEDESGVKLYRKLVGWAESEI